MNSEDIGFMRAALAMARRGLGRVAPNPSVGCVIVKKGVVVGRGVTADGGRPHAEAAALAQAGAAARGATAYVTLEPCAVKGRGEPCAGALVRAGVARVVVACIDPNPQVLGHGVQILKDADIEITTSVLEQEARELNKGFILKVTENRPMVTLKIAITADGMIAPAGNEPLWITGDMARRYAHLERSKYDAIMIGKNTALIDGPMLTTRIEGYTHTITRIVLDSKLEISLDSPLVKSAQDVPLWIFHNGNPEKESLLIERGVKLFTGTSVDKIVQKLADLGITRLQVEGGAKTLKSFAEAGLCDEFYIYRAPTKTFPGGKFGGFEEIKAKLGLKLRETRVLGEDLLEIYGR